MTSSLSLSHKIMLVSLFKSFRDTSFRIVQRIAQQLHHHHPLGRRHHHRRGQIASYLLVFFYVVTCLLNPSSLSVSALSCKSTTLKGLKCLTDQVAIISTPNFPHRFETPYVMEWIIDAYGGKETSDSPHIIYLYLNQMYLKTNFTVMASTYSPYDVPVQVPSPVTTTTTTTPMGPPSGDDDVKVTYFDPDHDETEAGHDHDTDQYYDIYGDDLLIPPQQQLGQQSQQEQRTFRRSVVNNSFPSSEKQKRPEAQFDNSILKDSAADHDYPDGLRPQSLVKPQSMHSRNFVYNPRDDDKSQLRIGPSNCGRLLRKEMFPYSTFSEDTLKELGLIFTTCRYLSIKIELYSPYTSHIRVRDHLLDVYGFNISYSVNDIDVPPAPSRCSAYNCTYNGHCFLSHDYR